MNAIRKSTHKNAFTIHKNSLKLENRFLIGKKPTYFVKYFKGNAIALGHLEALNIELN